MSKELWYWFNRLVFKFMYKTTGLQHACYFWESEVRDIRLDPRCVHCGKLLSVASREKKEGIKVNF